MYVLSWQSISVLTRVLFWYLFNKHQNNPLVSAETILHLSTYIVLYLMWWLCGVSTTKCESMILVQFVPPTQYIYVCVVMVVQGLHYTEFCCLLEFKFEVQNIQRNDGFWK